MNLSNDSLATNASGPVPSSATSPAEPAVIITVAVLSIVGNLLVIVVSTRRQTFPSASQLFIASMACSDLLVGISVAFFVAPAEAGEWVYSDTTARVCTVIGASSGGLSYYALAGLNLDRLSALMNDGVGISRKKVRIFLISAWVGIYAWYIFSVVYGVPVYYDLAMALPTFDMTTHLWFTIVYFFVTCSGLIVAMYCVVRILKALCTQHEPPVAAVFHITVNGPGGVPPQNANPQPQPAPQNIHTDNSDRSYAKIVLILTLVQTIMPLPALCALIASHLGYDLPTFLFWSTWVAFSNFFLDVVVYSVCQKSFRKAVKEIATFVASFLYKKCCCQNRVEVTDQQNIQMSSL
uniref:G-protein coupled receptors family 1 profile domain-containing protein n=1 Tax=Branchiostoma floridae TaxID=7739 RepID=C3ZS84_BRAFL|eukprot:XP_002588605.1 hypothetical protein BRAFLDRAFT_107514 [Branchiostoma floridae]